MDNLLSAAGHSVNIDSRIRSENGVYVNGIQLEALRENIMDMSKRYGRILIVDDDADVLTAASLLLKQHFGYVSAEKNPEMLLHTLDRGHFDIVLLDMNFKSTLNTGNEGFYWLNTIRAHKPELSVVLFTAYGDVEMAVRAVKEGASDFVLKPWQNEKFVSTIASALHLSEARRTVSDLKQKQKHLIHEMAGPAPEIIGESESLKQVFKTLRKVAPTDANVLILGENGTGKDLLARAIHRHSLRANEVFVSVDLGSVSTGIFESEMFGHKKGAFTDAREDRKGRLELASEGTLFLDEIANLNLEQQGKLLSALQNREIFPVGGSRPVRTNFRLISATNVPLAERVESMLFRQDLYFRMRTVEIVLPPLRERREDIPALVKFYTDKFSRRYNKPIHSIDKSVYHLLHTYHWPGNIRELQHCMERAVIMCESEILSREDILLESNTSKSSAPLIGEIANLDEIEKLTIVNILKKCNGNISSSARELGLTRAALYRRIEKYGL